MPADPATATWGVVVPVKRLALAKSRLSAYGDQARRELALAFAVDVVTAALDCPAVSRVLVVTDDEQAADALRALGAAVVPDDPDAGLNAALEHGAQLVAGSRGGVDSTATVSSDLPALRPADLAAALAQVPPGGRGFVPDAAGSGTTLLAAASAVDLAPAYGAGSAARHRASGAVELPAGAGLRRDVDTPQDLSDALRLGVGAATAAAVALLGLDRAARRSPSGCTMTR